MTWLFLLRVATGQQQKTLMKLYQQVAEDNKDFDDQMKSLHEQLLASGRTKGQADNFIKLMKAFAITNDPENPAQFVKDFAMEIERATSVGNGLNQDVFQGTPHEFEAFDSSAIGTGEGVQAHGYGFYFAKSKEVGTRYKDRLALVHYGENGKKGVLLKVDIPENDVLLDEQKAFAEQPPKVKEALQKLAKELFDKTTYSFDELVYTELFTGRATHDKDGVIGATLYENIAVALMRAEEEHYPASYYFKEASLALNSVGIKGIKYDGRRDGECFVIFDDKAIKILEKYNQDAPDTSIANEVLNKETQAQAEAIRKKYEGTDEWLKAPNGEKSNLTPKQWCMVRTEAFKNWFGDWEVIANSYPKYYAEERLDTEKYVNDLKGKELTSKDNVIAMFSSRGRNKIVSDAALNKSKRNGFTVEEHFTAVANAGRLFSNSIKVNERNDDDNAFLGIEHYSSLFTYEQNKPALVTFTVKVTNNAGRKVYSIELMELKKPGGKVQQEVIKPRTATPDSDVLNISEIAEKVNNASKILDENGEPRVMYHGTSRADRVGDVFIPDRATSGPMAFFTSSFDIATNYSKDKPDTSIMAEAVPYEEQFRIKLDDGESVTVAEYWNKLNATQKTKVVQLAGQVTLDSDAENIVLDKKNKQGLGGFSYTLKEHKGNGLAALVENWLTDGNLFGEEEKFAQVLKLCGIENDRIIWDNPDKVDRAVYQVFLNVKHPFNSTNVDEQFVKDVEVASKNAPQTQRVAGDMWNKNNQPPEVFVSRLREDVKNGTSHAWTSIPDWVTTLLKEKGYDGIEDVGGKNGGQEHMVVVPFTSNQIKSVDNNGNFSAVDDNIYHQEQTKDVKGQIHWEAEGKAIIGMFEGADASTVIHETGHYFVETMLRLRREGRASERQIADIDTLLAYAGLTFEQWEAMSFEERTEAHELFARSFEKYIIEGKAPTKELRSVFNKFSKWLKNIYRLIRQDDPNNPMNINLSDDVRQVFDRMLASEDEIAEIERVEGYFAKLPPVVVDNMSEATKRNLANLMFKAHDMAVEMLTKDSLINFTTERREKIAKYRAEITPGIDAEVRKEPLYAAQEQIEEYVQEDRKNLAIKNVSKNALKLQKTISEEENIANGKQALTKIIETHEDVANAMYREDIGDIDFVWGDQGRGAKFKHGYGIAHIIAKRDADFEKGLSSINGKETVEFLIDVIAKGTVVGLQEGLENNGEARIKLGFNDFTAVLSLPKGGNAWLLTGFENYKEAATNASGEGFDSSAATATKPTLTRQGRAVTASITNNLSQNTINGKSLANKYSNLLAKAKDIEAKPWSDKDQVFVETVDYVAEVNGFSSGEALAEAILDSPTVEQAIKERVQAQVNQQFPDIYTERDQAAEAARQALNSDKTYCPCQRKQVAEPFLRLFFMP